MNEMDIDDSCNGYSLITEDGRSTKYSGSRWWRSRLGAAVIALGLLCLLLLLGLVGQAAHFNEVTKSQQNDYNAVTLERDSIKDRLSAVIEERNQLQGLRGQLQTNSDSLLRENKRLTTNNNLLRTEKQTLTDRQNQLQSQNTALTRERDQLKACPDQLQATTKTLSKARDQLQNSSTSLTQQRDQYKNSYRTAAQERDQLQNQYNILTRAREQLQISCNAMAEKLEKVQVAHNSTASEKDLLLNNQANLTQEFNQLLSRYNVLVKARDELQASYMFLKKERDQLNSSYSNVTEEWEQLKASHEKLRLEHQQLLAKLNITTGSGSRTSTGQLTCPPGWRQLADSCYYLSKEKKSWNKSREDCLQRWADLAILESEEEMVFLNEIHQSNDEAWIGLTDGGTEGVWKWVDGTPMTASYWAPGQPNSQNGKEQDCAEFWHHSSGRGNWNDENCEVATNWICEKKLS